MKKQLIRCQTKEKRRKPPDYISFHLNGGFLNLASYHLQFLISTITMAVGIRGGRDSGEKSATWQGI